MEMRTKWMADEVDGVGSIGPRTFVLPSSSMIGTARGPSGIGTRGRSRHRCRRRPRSRPPRPRPRARARPARRRRPRRRGLRRSRDGVGDGRRRCAANVVDAVVVVVGEVIVDVIVIADAIRASDHRRQLGGPRASARTDRPYPLDATCTSSLGASPRRGRAIGGSSGTSGRDDTSWCATLPSPCEVPPP